MKKLTFLLFALCYFLVTIPVSAKGKPWDLEVKKISKNIMVISSWGVNVVAVKSEKGIVVIDAHNFPAIASDVREAIENEFGSKNFVYLINTHHHLDQTGGNQVFPEAEVLGTKCCADNMKKGHDNFNYFLSKGNEKIEMLDEEIKSYGESESEKIEKLKMQKDYLEYMLSDLKTNYKSVPPSRFINDKESIDLGNLTLKFYCLSKCHSESDIVIVIPEEKTAFIGDLNDKFWLAKEDAQKGPQWLAQVYSILNENGRMINIIGGHEPNLTPEQAEYRKAMNFKCDEINGRKSAAYQYCLNINKNGTGAAYDVFKKVKNDNNLYFSIDQYLEVIAMFIRMGKDGEAIKSIQLLVNEYNEDVLNKTELENIVNRQGYKLLKEKNTDIALEYLHLNTKAFPNSWNSHDSYAEALLQKGETIQALESYLTSLKLNANNRNILKVLKKLDANWSLKMPVEAKKISELMK